MVLPAPLYGAQDHEPEIGVLMSAASASIDSVLRQVATTAEGAGVFGAVELREGRLVCRAKSAAAPASYRLTSHGGRLWVSLVTADRWLSESIESDLMHTGDKLEDLLEEEFAELGRPGERPRVEHFRSDDLLFTFRSEVPSGAAGHEARTASAYLLAYEACFRRLGDMESGGAE
jgi:hypothetical protein